MYKKKKNYEKYVKKKLNFEKFISEKFNCHNIIELSELNNFSLKKKKESRCYKVKN